MRMLNVVHVVAAVVVLSAVFALGIALGGLAVFTLLGVVFGFALAAAAVRFHVASNPLVDRVREALPAANCGACGFAGCQVYAEAVVERPEVAPSLCAPGRRPVADSNSAQIAPQSGSTVGRSVGQMRSGCVAMYGNGCEIQ